MLTFTDVILLIETQKRILVLPMQYQDRQFCRPRRFALSGLRNILIDFKNLYGSIYRYVYSKIFYGTVVPKKGTMMEVVCFAGA